MRRHRKSIVSLGAALILFLVSPPPSAAQLYTDDQLIRKLQRIESNLRYTVEEDMPKHVDPKYATAVRQFNVELPLRGQTPLDFSASGNKLTIPVEGLQFIDDLATLRAWLDTRKCRSAMLFPSYLYRLAKGDLVLNPMTAFSLRSDALLRDPDIDNLSGKYYTSAIWFLIAHELGHATLGHRSQPGDASIAQERAADAFAMDVMRRRRLNPAGIFLYFLATSFYEPLASRRRHPTSFDRISAAARELKRSPQEFVAPESKDPTADAARVLSIADSLAGISKLLQDVQTRREAAARATGTSSQIDGEVFAITDFRSACPEGRRG